MSKEPTEYYLWPIEKPHHNVTLKGYPSEVAEGGRVLDLHAYRNEESFDSTWKCKSIWERLKFLWHGEITLRVMGDKTAPPCSIAMGDVYKKVYAKFINGVAK